jgi:hypothetical protein
MRLTRTRVWTHVNIVYILVSYLFKIHFNIILLSITRYFKWSHHFSFSDQHLVFTSKLSRVYCMPTFSGCLICYSNSTQRRIYTLKLLTVQCVLSKYDGRLWTGLMWLKVGTSGGPF